MAQASDVLFQVGIEDARRNAGSLLGHVLGRDPAFLLAHSEELLTDEQALMFQNCIARRAAGEPQQYITGHQEFYKLDFEVTPDVLIPRPETEAIVEATLQVLKDERAPYLADIGTGSGCIAISILKERNDALAVATDTSAAALAIASRNAQLHGVNDRLKLIESDLLTELEAREQFFLLASNPPYVADDDWASLPREVRNYEPRRALTSGADGLTVIRRLLLDTPQYLRAGGHLVFEIGFGQEQPVRDLIDSGVWQLTEVRRDLQGVPRTILLQKK
jgi:release factor glutamine methyltransferase